jgi:hypothetical protein
MPFSFTPDQKQTAFWLAIWLACGLLFPALGRLFTPVGAAAVHLRHHDLGSSFYNA